MQNGNNICTISCEPLLLQTQIYPNIINNVSDQVLFNFTITNKTDQHIPNTLYLFDSLFDPTVITDSGINSEQTITITKQSTFENLNTRVKFFLDNFSYVAYMNPDNTPGAKLSNISTANAKVSLNQLQITGSANLCAGPQIYPSRNYNGGTLTINFMLTGSNSTYPVLFLLSQYSYTSPLNISITTSNGSIPNYNLRNDVLYVYNVTPNTSFIITAVGTGEWATTSNIRYQIAVPVNYVEGDLPLTITNCENYNKNTQPNKYFNFNYLNIHNYFK